MFGLFSRRKKREREAQARRDALRAKAGTTTSASSLSPGETYRDGIAWDFADALIAIADPVGNQPAPAPRTYTASPDYSPVKSEQELPIVLHAYYGFGGGGGGGGSSGGAGIGKVGSSGGGGSGRDQVTQHHHGTGDNIGGSVHHSSHSSHSSHDYSSGSSYDSGSYDSGSSSGSDSSW